MSDAPNATDIAVNLMVIGNCILFSVSVALSTRMTKCSAWENEATPPGYRVTIRCYILSCMILISPILGAFLHSNMHKQGEEKMWFNVFVISLSLVTPFFSYFVLSSYNSSLKITQSPFNVISSPLALDSSTACGEYGNRKLDITLYEAVCMSFWVSLSCSILFSIQSSMSLKKLH